MDSATLTVSRESRTGEPQHLIQWKSLIVDDLLVLLKGRRDTYELLRIARQPARLLLGISGFRGARAVLPVRM